MKLANKTLAVRFNYITIIAVYFLILVGGIVRSTGAGMGCPDWPKCFGGYIPPADVSALPENYEDVYAASRIKKNNRLASTLKALSLEGLARQVTENPLTLEKTEYNPQKAWIEYVNRLVGVLIGFMIIGNMVYSFTFRKEHVWIPILGVLAFVLVVFQGWVGSLVVSTNLLPGFITFHMILALALVGLLLVQRFKMKMNPGSIHGRWLVSLILVLFTLQIVLGTQVREQIDLLKIAGVVKSNMIGELGTIFYIHRSYSLLLIVLVGWLIYKNVQKNANSLELWALAGIVVVEVLLGIIMAYFAIPAFAQPAHLFFGTVAYGVLFYLFLQSNFNKEIA